MMGLLLLLLLGSGAARAAVADRELDFVARAAGGLKAVDHGVVRVAVLMACRGRFDLRERSPKLLSQQLGLNRPVMAMLELDAPVQLILAASLRGLMAQRVVGEVPPDAARDATEGRAVLFGRSDGFDVVALFDDELGEFDRLGRKHGGRRAGRDPHVQRRDGFRR
jgi:hypothetical protein